MMFIMDGYEGLKSEFFQGYCSFLEDVHLHYFVAFLTSNRR